MNNVEIIAVKKRPCNFDKIQGIIYANINGSREELITPLFYSELALRTYIKKLKHILRNTTI